MNRARASFVLDKRDLGFAEKSQAATTASLGSRVVAGAKWTTLSSVGVQVLLLIRSIVLARLLTKDEFGLAGLALTVLAAASVFTNFGLQASIVAKPATGSGRRRQLDTVFTVELGRAALLAGLLVLLAKPAAAFYGDDRLTKILLVLAILPLVQALTNIGMVMYAVDVKMLRPAVLDFCSAAAATVAAVVFAVLTHDAFAVVLAQLAATCVAVALSYLLHPYRPRLAFDLSAFRDAFAFGKYVFLIGTLVFVTTVGDNIAVGRLLGSVELAGYLVAYALANLPQTLVSRILGTVLFPSFAEAARGDADLLRGRVRRSLVVGGGMLTLITAPMIVVSVYLLGALYGTKFESATRVLQVLMIVGLCRGLIQIISPLVMGLARPDLEARSKVLEAALFLVLVVPLTMWLGAVGAAAAAAVTYVIALFLRMRYASRLVPGAFARPLELVAGPLASGVASIAVGEAALLALPAGTNHWINLITGGGAALAAACAGLLAFSPAFRKEIGSVAHKLRNKRAKVA